MALLEILLYPNPVLKQPTEKVININATTLALLDNMAETMYKARGIGLAAPQVGAIQRVCVVDVSEARNERIDFINPEIVWSEGKTPSEEGCLSIPDYRDTIARKEKIVVQAQDRVGKEFELEADGLLAICIQHEVDHLDGILFVDHLSRLKRELFKRWAKRHLEL